MDTNEEKIIEENTEEVYDNNNSVNEEVNVEEYYDENADEIYNEKYEKPSLYKKYRHNKNSFVISCLVFFFFFSVIFGPVFTIKEINITGNSRISRDAILQKSGISEGVNILRADLVGAQKKIASIPFVYDVTVQRRFPSSVSIAVTECFEVGYVSYIGNYVGVSNYGKVLEIVENTADANIPVIKGFELKETNVGEQISFVDESVSETVMQYLDALENNNILSHIKYIDFTDINDVKLTLSNDILVKMGQADKVAYKFAYLEKIFGQLEGQRGGVLDISDPAGSVVYRAS